MKTYLECVSCFVRQAVDASRMASDDPAVHQRVLRQTLRLAAEMPLDQSPPWMGQRIHSFLREAIDEEDPYAQAKQSANRMALALLPELHRDVERASDPFAAAVRLAIAGNIIDLGCKSRLTDEEVHHAIDTALQTDVDDRALESFRQAVADAEDILYLADNAGEIVLDRLLIERLPLDRVTVVVRGQAIINDATRVDAEAAGLTELVPVIDNGSDVPGTILDQCPESFRKRFRQADLIIAKGQGNYETLSYVEHNICFLLKAKCEVIARDIGCPVGQTVVLHRYVKRNKAQTSPTQA